MDDQLGDETEVEQAARDLRSAAELATQGGLLVENQILEAEWAGPMRDRYAANAEQQRKELEQESNELLELAGLLDSHAAWIRDEKSRLDGLQNRIEDWAGANPVGSSPDGQDASLVAIRPPRYNFGWDDVADFLRGRGIAF
jgi:hypothetical protein